ncbi:MAG: adenylate/guanylate cyclase domain-containing protein [Hyphomicrobiaceae bacterium]
MKRKIVAILASDVARYSKLVAEDEEETLRRLSSYREVFDAYIAQHRGRVFNTAGDAVMVEFGSAVDAVRCAVDVQESLRTRNLAYPESRKLAFRMGISIGDVVEQNGDLLGDGVNVAARLEGLAEPGGICISRNVFEAVSNKLSATFVDLGPQEVKNIPRPVHAYQVGLQQAPQVVASPTPISRPKRALGPMLATLAALLAGAGLAYAGLRAFAPPPPTPVIVTEVRPATPTAPIVVENQAVPAARPATPPAPPPPETPRRETAAVPQPAPEPGPLPAAPPLPTTLPVAPPVVIQVPQPVPPAAAPSPVPPSPGPPTTKQALEQLSPRPPRKPTPVFDGNWRITLTGGPQCSVKTSTWTLTVREGNLVTNRGEPGWVDDTGKFEFWLPARVDPTKVVIYRGQLNKAAGQGQYATVGGGCVGALALRRE